MKRKKKLVQKMDCTIQVRLTSQEKNKIRARAQIFAGGNISLWMIHAALNTQGEYLVIPEKKEA